MPQAAGMEIPGDKGNNGSQEKKKRTGVQNLGSAQV